MKEKNFEIGLLNQLYGSLLTEKQTEMLKAYYDFDFSLAEIADEYKISRQAVRDNIKRAELTLNDFEEKLKFLSIKQSVGLKLAKCKKALSDGQSANIELLQILNETEKALEGD